METFDLSQKKVQLALANLTKAKKIKRIGSRRFRILGNNRIEAKGEI